MEIRKLYETWISQSRKDKCERNVLRYIAFLLHRTYNVIYETRGEKRRNENYISLFANQLCLEYFCVFISGNYARY